VYIIAVTYRVIRGNYRGKGKIKIAFKVGRCKFLY
jgi:hypothetical protein